MRVVSGVAALTAAISMAVIPAIADAAPQLPCYARAGHLYCGNKAPTKIYARPSYGYEDSRGAFHATPVVDTLKSNPSYFNCYRRGADTGGGNNVWYYTYGDVTRRWGYVPAVNVYTNSDPFPGVSPCA